LQKHLADFIRDGLMTGSSAIDPKQFRRVLGRWATGVAVMTTIDANGQPKGITVNSFASVSLDPPLVLWSIAKTAQSLSAFRRGCVFAVNFLGQGQQTIAKRFATSGGAKFTDVAYRRAVEGPPLLDGAAASLVCEATEEHEGGDHIVIIGRVVGMVAESLPPLLFVDGAFASVGPQLPAGENDATVVVIGDEVVSGATTDVNGPRIARHLTEAGITVREIIAVPDDIAAIAGAVRRASASRKWVVTSGGLGSTHDDVTAVAIARAFGRELKGNAEALLALQNHHAPSDVPCARLACAQLPDGATALPELVSGACAFRIANVVALPGTVEIVEHLLDRLGAELSGGAPLHEESVKVAMLEEELADSLREIQQKNPAVRIGSYPYYGSVEAHVNVVLRSADKDSLERCRAELAATVDSILTVRRGMGAVRY
jgi:molybdenum cofactor synthesis domain-containing protein